MPTSTPSSRLGELGLPGPRRRFGAEADLAELLRIFPGEEVQQLLRVSGSGGELDAGIDVLGVFTEDHHVDLFGMFDRRRHAAVPADRPQADVQVEQLSKRHVQGANAAADGGRQRPLDADEVFTERFDSIVWKPAVELLEALLAGVDLQPGDPPLVAEGFLHSRVEHANACAPDVRAGAVPLDEGNDRIVGYDEHTVLARDRGAAGWRFERREVRHGF
jgi:hypothetical protein